MSICTKISNTQFKWSTAYAIKVERIVMQFRLELAEQSEEGVNVSFRYHPPKTPAPLSGDSD